MQVEIWSDIACPWCYVGKRRFETALKAFSHADAVTIIWRSFELDPNAPRQHTEPQPELLARKYRTTVEEAQRMNARMTEAAAAEGLTFSLAGMKTGNTFDAHRLLHLAASEDAKNAVQPGAVAGIREALGERLFAAYLGEGASLGDVETLVALATEAGLSADTVRQTLATDAFADAVRRDEAEAQAIGVTGVPFFVLDRKYGVSGAQSPEVLAAALQQAWDERTPAVTMVGSGNEAADCSDGSCAVEPHPS